MNFRWLVTFVYFAIALTPNAAQNAVVITKVVSQSEFYIPKEVIKKAKAGTGLNIYSDDGQELIGIGRIESCSKFRCVVKVVKKKKGKKIKRGSPLTRRKFDFKEKKKKRKKKKKKKKKKRKKRRKKKKRKKRRKRYKTHVLRAGLGPPLFMTNYFEYTYMVSKRIAPGAFYGIPTRTPSKILISGSVIGAKLDFSFSRPLYYSGFSMSVYGGMMMVTLDFSQINGADNHTEDMSVFFGGTSFYYNYRISKSFDLRFGGGIQYNMFPESVTNAQTDEIKIPFTGIGSTLEVFAAYKF